MRKIKRLDAPAFWQEKQEKWNNRFVARKKKKAAAKFSWPTTPKGSYLKIRDELLKMTQDHCAFCDGALGVESRETIEHFRPKGVFHALAYTWENLFPCCDTCQSEKREEFDDRLLKPDEIEYQFYDYFMVDYETGAIRPAISAINENQEKAAVTIRLYGLDSPKRRKARLKELKAFRPEEGDSLDEFNYRFFLEYAL